MASTQAHFIRNLFKGTNQSFGRHLLQDGEAWNLLNFRPDRGKLRVTPPLVESFALQLLTSEVTVTQIKLLKLVRNLNNLLRYVIINEKNARYVDPEDTSIQVRIPNVRQSRKPNDATITGECLLYGFNVTDFAATNDTIEVETDSATTFRWRRNADAWTSGVTIGPEVALGINGLKVSFQTDEGFPIGSNWLWTQHLNVPYTGADLSTFNFPYQTDVFNKDVYVSGIERNVMRIRDDFLTSVGYTRVYGKYVTVFQNKLFVGQYAAGVHDPIIGIKDGYDAANTPFVVGWSHRDNPDQFFSSDINEADEFQFPQQAASDWSNFGITGMGELNDRIFVYLPTSIKVGVDVGLPTVMQWNTAHPSIGNLFPAGLVKSSLGHFFISKDDVYHFNGIEIKSVGQKVIEKFNIEIAPITDIRYSMTRGDYDADRAEVIFTYWMKISTGVYQARQMIYQEKTGEWYFRNLPSASSTATDIYCQTRLVSNHGKQIYGGLGVVYKDWTTEVAATYPRDDITTGVALYTNPLVETGIRDFGWRHSTKEISSMLVDYDSNHFNIHRLRIHFAAGHTITKLGAYEEIGIYEPDLYGQIGKWFTFPKKSFRVAAFKFFISNGDGEVPVRDGLFYGYEEYIYGISEGTEK